MRLPLFIYQALAEPVREPDAGVVETITLDKWWQPTQTPPKGHQPRLPGHWSGVTENTLLAKPPGIGWWSQPEEPIWTVPPREEGMFSVPTEPSLFAGVPDMDSWFRPLDVPTLPRKRPLPTTGDWQSDPSLREVPDFDSWFRELERPTLPPARIHPSAGGAYQWENALFTDVDLADWWMPTQIPQMRVSPRLPGLFVSGIEPSLITVPDFDSWFRETVAVPIRLRLHPSTPGFQVLANDEVIPVSDPANRDYELTLVISRSASLNLTISRSLTLTLTK